MRSSATSHAGSISEHSSQQTRQSLPTPKKSPTKTVTDGTPDKPASNKEVPSGASNVNEQQSEKKDKPVSSSTAAQNKEVPSVPNIARRRLLQVAFDSPTTKPANEESKPNATNEERPKPLSLFKNTPIVLNSDDDFMPASQPVITKPVSSSFYLVLY